MSGHFIDCLVQVMKNKRKPYSFTAKDKKLNCTFTASNCDCGRFALFATRPVCDCVPRVQGSERTGPEQTLRSPAAFLLSRLLSGSCMATSLQVYSESIQQLQLSAIEDLAPLSDAKSVWAAPQHSLHLPASSEKQLSLGEWGRIYTSKKDTLNTFRPTPERCLTSATSAECQTTLYDLCLLPSVTLKHTHSDTN